MKRIVIILLIIQLLSCKETTAKNDNNPLFLARNISSYGFIDNNGDIVISLKYTYAKNFTEGLAAVAIDSAYKKEGYINKNGEMIISPIYEDAEPFSEGLAGVKKNGLWGFINKKGEMIIDLQYDSVSQFSEGLAAVILKEMAGFIDTAGEVVITPQYELAGSFHNGLAAVGLPIKKGQKGIKYGYIDKSNNLIIDMIYGHAGAFTNGYAVVTLIDGPFQLIDKTGKDILSDIKHGGVKEYTEGLLPIYYNGAYCYMTIDKEVIIEPQFKSVTSFSEGRAFVSFDRMTWGIIDNKGNMICEPRFKSISPFQNGLAKVQIDTDPRPPVTYINRDGEIVWPKDIQ